MTALGIVFSGWFSPAASSGTTALHVCNCRGRAVPCRCHTVGRFVNAVLDVALLTVQVLLEPFHIDRKGEIPAGQRPTYAMRLFSWQVIALLLKPTRDAPQQ